MSLGLPHLNALKKEIRVLSFEADHSAFAAHENDRELPLAYKEPQQAGSTPEIRCTISPIALGSADPRDSYSALSYVWGAQEPKTPISLNGHQLCVVPNLLSALQHLRRHSKVRGQNLWIDAICIDQTDNQEKGSQIDMMGEIYGRADQVFIWLGEEGEQSNLAMALLNSLPLNENGAELQPFLDSTVGDDKSWIALRRLFERDYWRRVWVLQEVLLSQKAYVFCGDRMCSWEAIMALLRQSNYIDNVSINSRPARQAILEAKLLPVLLVDIVRRRREGKTGLLDYLVLSRQRRATVAHDYIYGVMGLISEQVIRADYKQTVEDVYKQMALYMLQHEKNLGILSMCCETTVDRRKLPTWVPDWRNQFQEDYQSFLLCHQNYDAGLTSKHKPDIDILENGRVLQLTCILVDTISFTSPPQPDLNRWPQVGEDWTAWQAGPVNKSNRYGSFDGQSEAFRSTLSSHRDGKQSQNDGSDIYFKIAVSESNTRPTAEMLTNPKRSYGKAGRQFFGTETGFMGRGLYSVKKGDVVAVFKGAKVPFVLRKTDMNGLYGAYHLVGECYLHGVMKGEIVKNNDDLQWSDVHLL